MSWLHGQTKEYSRNLNKSNLKHLCKCQFRPQFLNHGDHIRPYTLNTIMKKETEKYNKMIAGVDAGNIRAMYDLDRFVSECEPFYRNFVVYPCTRIIPNSIVERATQIHNEIESHIRSCTRFFIYKEPRTSPHNYRVIFAIHEGANGAGQFMELDVVNVLSILQYLRKHTCGATLTEMSHDIPDDVSDWGVVFYL